MYEKKIIMFFVRAHGDNVKKYFYLILFGVALVVIKALMYCICVTDICTTLSMERKLKVFALMMIPSAACYGYRKVVYIYFYSFDVTNCA